MIKRWLTLIFEYVAFFFILCFLSFLYIEPRIESNFKKIIEDRIGLKSNIGAFYFSPTGKIRGKNIHLEGELKNGQSIEIFVGSYFITPKELIYELVIDKKENFSWADIGYDLKLNDIKFKFADSNLIFNVDEITVNLDKENVKGDIEGLVFSNFDNNGKLDKVSLDINPDFTELSIANLEGENKKEKFILQDINLKLNPITLNELLTHISTRKIEPLAQLCDELRLSSLSLKNNKITVEAARLIKVEDNSWDVYAKLTKNSNSFELTPHLKINNKDEVSLSGIFSNPIYEHSLTYNLKGPMKDVGKWTLEAYDKFNNKLDVQITKNEDGPIIATWDLLLKQLKIKQLQGTPISGKLSGGLSTLADLSKLQLKVDAQKLSGTQFNFNSLDLNLDASFEDNIITLNNLSCGEDKVWNANLTNGIYDLSKKQPQKFSLSLKKFPLGKFSPKVSGELDAKLNFIWPKLKANIVFEELYPDKDILQKVKNFNADLLVDDKQIHYKQSFIQSGDTNTLETKIKIIDFFSNLFENNKGILSTFKSRSSLFDLKLAKAVPVKVDYRGVKVPSFLLQDNEQRLNQISGNAYIPFFKPRDLLIKLNHAIIDLEKFPTIASSPVIGKLTVHSALWDKGWSLRNLVANFNGKNLSISPSALLLKTKISYIKGDLSNFGINISDLRASPKNGGELNVKGSYNLYHRYLDIFIKGQGLNYESDSYNLNYNLKDFKVVGKVNQIHTSGNLFINNFNYSEPFAVLDSDSEIDSSLNISLPDTPNVEHTLDLNVSNTKPLQLANNAGQLTFNIEDLNLKGSLYDPAWTGDIISTTSASNKLSLPIKPLDISFESPRVRLIFNNDTEWNPKLILRAITNAKETQIFLHYDGPLNNFKSDFQLSSQPPLSKNKIIELLTRGKASETNIFSTNPNNNTDTTTPKINFTKGISFGKDSVLKPIVETETGQFEFNFSYSLNEYLELDITQDFSNQYQLGLRLSKSENKLRNILDFRKKRIEEVENDIVKIEWDISGTNIFEDPFFKKDLLEKLKRANASLERDDYKDARSITQKIISQYLAEKGYLFGNAEISSMQKMTKRYSRHNDKKVYFNKEIKVKLNLTLGQRYVINKVILNGWPKNVELNTHSQINKTHQRKPIYQLKNIEKYKKILIRDLQNKGYAAAQIKSMEIKHINQLEPTIDSNIKNFNTKNILERKTKEVDICISIDAGEIHQLAQLHFLGNQKFKTKALLKTLSINEGDAFIKEILNSQMTKILNWYEQNDFFNTNVSVKILRSRYYNRVSLHFMIEEGEQWNVRNIIIEGLNETSKDYIKQYIPDLKGKRANKAIVTKLIKNLALFRSFVSVTHKWVDTKNENFKDLKIAFEETKNYDFSTRIGFESEEGINASLSISQHHLFHRPLTLSFEGGFSEHESLRKISLNHRKLIRSLDAQLLVAQKRERISSLDFINSQTLLKMSLFKRHNNVVLRRGSVLFQSDDNFQNSNKSVRFQYSKSFSTHLIGPQKGFDYSLFSSFNEYLTENHKFIYQGDYKLKYGFKLGKSILSPWIRYAHHEKFGSNFYIPLSDRYFLGGPNSLRGFKNDEIAGNLLQGGENLFSSGIQLFYPFSSWLDGSIFYENGNIYNQPTKIRFSKLRETIGFSLLFRTPVGPIQAFFGKPTENSHGRFGIQLGTGF